MTSKIFFLIVSALLTLTSAPKLKVSHQWKTCSHAVVLELYYRNEYVFSPLLSNYFEGSMTFLSLPTCHQCSKKASRWRSAWDGKYNKNRKYSFFLDMELFLMKANYFVEGHEQTDETKKRIKTLFKQR